MKAIEHAHEGRVDVANPRVMEMSCYRQLKLGIGNLTFRTLCSQLRLMLSLFAREVRCERMAALAQALRRFQPSKCQGMAG